MDLKRFNFIPSPVFSRSYDMLCEANSEIREKKDIGKCRHFCKYYKLQTIFCSTFSQKWTTNYKTTVNLWLHFCSTFFKGGITSTQPLPSYPVLHPHHLEFFVNLPDDIAPLF